MKRYDFDWGYVGIERREDDYGEWVRYVDALAFYSEALDEAYLHGKANAQAARPVSALPVEWPELANRLYTRAEVQEMLHEAYSEGHKDEAESMSQAARDILAERLRQQESEGYTTEHDDNHYPAELARAALCYADIEGCLSQEEHDKLWPWNALAWKPKDPRRDLVRAAALLHAAIECGDRNGHLAWPDGRPDL